MPWTIDDPPDVAKKWTAAERRRCVAAANAVLEDGGADEDAIFACIHAAGRGQGDTEEKAMGDEDAVKAATLKNQAKRLLADVEAILEEKALPDLLRKEIADVRTALHKTWAELQGDGGDGKSVSLDQQVHSVREAWYAQQRPQHVEPAAPSDVWVKEVFEDAVIVEATDGCYRYPYAIDAEGKITFGEPEKVEPTYVPAKSAASGYPYSRNPHGAIKTIAEDDKGVTVGGYLLLWGDKKHVDLQGDYFTPETWLGLDTYKGVPALFHHGLDDTVGLAVMGHRVSAKADDTGVWVEDWLDKSNRYWAMVAPLLKAEALYYSPGSAPHMVKREQDGKLLSYPVVEDTMTPLPAQPRLLPVAQIKAAYKAAGIDVPDGLDAEDSTRGGGDGAGAPCPDAERAQAWAEATLVKVGMLDKVEG